MLEIVVVVLIIGIVAAVATPRLAAALFRVQLQSVANSLRLDLESARQNAMHRGQARTVVFDFAAAEYSCDEISDESSPTGTLDVSLILRHGLDLHMTGNFVAADGITFSPDGELVAIDESGDPISIAVIDLQTGQQRWRVDVQSRLSLVTDQSLTP